MLVSKNLKSLASISQQVKSTNIPLFGQEALQIYVTRAEEEKKLINQSPLLSVQTQVRFIEQNRNMKAQSKYMQQSNLKNYLFDLQQNNNNYELALQLNIDHLSIGSMLIQNLNQAELQYIFCKIRNQSISPIIFVQAIFEHLNELKLIKQDFMLDNLLKNVVYLQKNIHDNYIAIIEQILALLQEMNYLKQSTPIVIASIMASIFELLTTRENLLHFRERKEIKQTGLSFFQKFNSIYNKSQYQKLQFVDFKNMLYTLCLYNSEIPIERQQFIVDEFTNFGIKHGFAQKLVELTGYLLICDVQLTENYFGQLMDNKLLKSISFKQLAILIQAMNQYNHFQTESQVLLFQILQEKLNDHSKDLQKIDFNLDLAFKMVITLLQMPVMTNKNISEIKIIRLLSNLQNICDEDDSLTVNQIFSYCIKINQIFKYPWAIIGSIIKQHVNLQFNKEQFIDFFNLYIDRYPNFEYDLLVSEQTNIEFPQPNINELVTKLLSMMHEELLDEKIFETLIRFGLQDHILLGEFIQQIIQQNLHNQINKENIFSFIRYINKYKLKLPLVNEKVMGFIEEFQPLQYFEIVYYLGIKEQPKILKLTAQKLQEFLATYQAVHFNYFNIESFYQTYSPNSQLSFKGLEYIVPVLTGIQLENQDIAKIEQIMERNCKCFYGDILIENLIGFSELGIRNLSIFKKCVDNITSVFRFNKQTDVLGLEGILKNKSFQLKLVQSYLIQVDENETKQYMGYKIIGFFASKVFNDLIDIELIALMKLLGNDPNNYTQDLLKQLKAFKFSDKFIFDAARYAPYQDQSFVQYLTKWIQNNKIKNLKQLDSFQNQQIHINNIDVVYQSLEKEMPTHSMLIKQKILSYLIDCYHQGIQMEKFMWAANQNYAKLDIQSQKSFIIIKALDQYSKKIHMEVTEHFALKQRNPLKFTKGLQEKINQLMETEDMGVYKQKILSAEVEFYPSLLMDRQESNPRWIVGFTARQVEQVDPTLLKFLCFEPDVKQNKLDAMIKCVIQESNPILKLEVIQKSSKYLDQRQINQKRSENFIEFFGPLLSAISEDYEPKTYSDCISSKNTVDLSLKKGVKTKQKLDVFVAGQQDIVYVNDKIALSPFMQLLAINQSQFNPTLVILSEPWIKKNYTKVLQEKFIQNIIEQL